MLNCPAVHPRKCGECKLRIAYSTGTTGSSPQVRGVRAGRGCDSARCRFIPASAGSAPGHPLGRLGCSVHPRKCGECVAGAINNPRNGRFIPASAGSARTEFSIRQTMTGSSPQVRGVRQGEDCFLRHFRFIPASAGSARPTEDEPEAWTVHPRKCGECISRSACGAVVVRFIPASAGSA